jgi:NADH-quinone oxidoreductase subunit J
MSVEKILFYIFSAILLSAAVLIVTRKNPVHSVLWLVVAFFNAAILWMMLEAEFLSIVLVLVYVGAVMVLFLFVVMMLDINITELRAGFVRNLPVAVLVAAVMMAEILLVVGSSHFGLDKVAAPVRHGADYNNTAELGFSLFTDHLYAFEIAAVILLVGIIAAISLTLRKRPETKYQDPSKQISVKSTDRLKMVKMDGED